MHLNIIAVALFMGINHCLVVVEEEDRLPLPEGFISLGQGSLFRGNAPDAVGESTYYVSNTLFSWSHAKKICESSGGTSLVIETQEDLDYLNEMLESFARENQVYWTDGAYVGRWVWSFTGEDIPPFAVPPSHTTPLIQDRLVLIHRNRLDSGFEILAESELRRVICEL